MFSLKQFLSYKVEQDLHVLINIILRKKKVG